MYDLFLSFKLLSTIVAIFASVLELNIYNLKNIVVKNTKNMRSKIWKQREAFLKTEKFNISLTLFVIIFHFCDIKA